MFSHKAFHFCICMTFNQLISGLDYQYVMTKQFVKHICVIIRWAVLLNNDFKGW